MYVCAGVFYTCYPGNKYYKDAKHPDRVSPAHSTLPTVLHSRSIYRKSGLIKTWWSKECTIKYYTIQYNRYAISMHVKTLRLR